MHSTMFAVMASMVAIGIQAQPPAAKKSEYGELFLSLMADAGIYEFKPLSEP